MIYQVNSANDFLGSIESGSEIILEAGFYTLSDNSLPYSKTVYYKNVFDGEELVFKDIHNLTISGQSMDDTHLLASPRYATVISFINCSNITISDIDIGHFPQDGSCAGGVLSFESCTNISINKTRLFGCGTIGIAARNCDNIQVVDSIITKSNQYLLYLVDTTNIKFSSCEFVENLAGSIELRHCDGVEFHQCNFEDNRNAFFEDKFLTMHDSCGKVYFGKCKIFHYFDEDDDAESIFDPINFVVLDDTDIKHAW